MKQDKKYKWLKTLTLVGCWSTGIIYTAIGVIAILSFLKIKQGGADESSFFVLLNASLAGRLLNWVIILGALCFITWRFYEAFHDPYKVGKDKKGILLRTGAAFSSFADAFIALSALKALFGQQKALVTGEPVQEREMVAQLITTNLGAALVIGLGVVMLATAVVLLLYGLSKRFTETIKASDFSRSQTYFVHGLAYAGYFARGVIVGITGFSFIRAVLKKDSSQVVNTDKAFDFIGTHVGHVYFILIAVGTICYGFYMFVLGLHYDIRTRRKS